MTITRRELLGFLSVGLAVPQLLGSTSVAEAAASITVGKTFNIDDLTGGSRESPLISPLPRGGFVAGWDNFGGSTEGPYVRFYGATGKPESKPISIPQLRSPSAAGNIDGSSLVAYPNFSDETVVIQPLTAKFVKNGDPRVISRPPTSVLQTDRHENVRSLRLLNGHILVCWQSISNDGNKLDVTILKGDGSVVVAANAILKEGISNILDVTALSSGGAAILYVEQTPDFRYLTRAIFLSAAGLVTGKSAVIRSSLDSDAVAACAATAKGGIVCMWTDFDGPTGPRMRGQFLGAKGVAGKRFQSKVDSKFWGIPGVAVTAKGHILVSHRGLAKVVNGHSNYAPFVTLFSATGVQIGKSVVLDIPVDRKGPHSTSLIRQKDGSFIVVWSRDELSSNNKNIFGRRITIA